MRASTYNIPRFLHSYDETLDGGLILPRGMLATVTWTSPHRQAAVWTSPTSALKARRPAVHVHGRFDTAPARGRHRTGRA